MSFNAEFKVAGTTYSIIECSIPMHQKYDQKGKPASGVHSGRIRLILEGTDDGTLGNWMSDPTKKQDGKLVFFRIDQPSTFKEVKFEGAYIVALMENFTTDMEMSKALVTEEGAINLDIGKEDDENHIWHKLRLKLLLASQHRTRMSYCMLVEITAEKITIDGVEHQN
jgi:hypothetical protein